MKQEFGRLGCGCVHICVSVWVCVCHFVSTQSLVPFVFEMMEPNKMGTRNFYRFLTPSQGLYGLCVEFPQDRQTNH